MEILWLGRGQTLFVLHSWLRQSPRLQMLLFRVQCFPSHDFMLLSPGFELSMEMTDNV